MCGVEVFTNGSPLVQYTGEVKLTIGLPFSELTFPLNASIEALTLIIIKTTSGYNDTNNYELRLNNSKLNINLFNIWEKSDNLETENFINLIKSLRKTLKKSNKLTIYHKNSNIAYFKYLLIYRLFEDSTNDFNESFIRWKLSL